MFNSVQAVAYVEDDDTVRIANTQSLSLAGFEVSAFATARDALAQIDANFPGVVVTDIRLPGMDGRQLFQAIREKDEDLPVILVTGHADISEAVDAMHGGAYDYLAKPYGADRLITSVRRALDKRRLVLDNRKLLDAARRAEASDSLIGDTPEIERLRATVRQVAEANVDVLLEGETGTGKELVARLLHRFSQRRAQSFVPIDFAAMPNEMVDGELFGHEAGALSGLHRRRVGRIESADRGTLFLDEIESMPLATQGKMLRVLEEREVTPVGGRTRSVDLRVVAAAKHDLKALVASNNFRRDLYYRLDVVRIRIPPLRERRADITLLFGRFLAEAVQRFGRERPALTNSVRLHLLHHEWPGNVRELRHFAERVALGADDMVTAKTTENLGSLPDRLNALEEQMIREALTIHSGDVQETIAALAIPRKTFYDKLHKHGIDIRSYRSR